VKEALVIHPRFFILGGGELLCLEVCNALQDAGYHVNLVSDTFDSEAVEKVYGLGEVLKKCHWIQIPEFKARLGHLLALQRMFYAVRVKTLLAKQKWDVAFSTQSSLFYVPTKTMYHFIYDIVDLFAYPHGLLSSSIDRMKIKGLHWRAYYGGLKLLKKMLYHDNPAITHFFALSQQVLDELRRNGHQNSSLIYPPCRTDFRPREKRPWIIQVTRIVPQKRLERFFQIAEMLPEYHFIIVGRDSPILRSLNPDYAERLMAKKPENVEYVEAPIKQVPRLLEMSQIYLYTGEEPGIGIALVEAIGAGCIPLSPSNGGGGEVVRATTGFIYRSPSEAVETIREIIQNGYSLSPDEIREKARPFRPEIFRQTIKELLA
jgi:glycosyltransferase involved in cell wall biosynthesis